MGLSSIFSDRKMGINGASSLRRHMTKLEDEIVGSKVSAGKFNLYM